MILQVSNVRVGLVSGVYDGEQSPRAGPKGLQEGERMDTGEWAQHLSTVVMTELEYFNLWVLRDIIGTSTWVVDGIFLPEIDVEVAERKARGERLMGVLPPCEGPDGWRDGNPQVQEAWDTENRETREHTRLVFRGPRAHTKVDDPDAVVFTPEDALADMRKYPNNIGMGVRATGPVTDIEAALMTAREAFAMVGVHVANTGGRMGPNAPVVLLLIHDAFAASSRHESAPYRVAYKIFNGRDGGVLSTGAIPFDIALT
jgi:hypothetical protein